MLPKNLKKWSCLLLFFLSSCCIIEDHPQQAPRYLASDLTHRPFHGGGTAGTGTIKVEGIIQNEAQEPLVSLPISLEGTPLSATTNKAGRFSMNIPEPESCAVEVELNLTVSGQSIITKIPKYSLCPAELEMVITVNAQNKKVTVDKLEQKQISH